MLQIFANWCLSLLVKLVFDIPAALIVWTLWNNIIVDYFNRLPHVPFFVIYFGMTIMYVIVSSARAVVLEI